jgi:hypothetical protein
MRILIVSLCSLALVGLGYGAQQQGKKSQSKGHAQPAQHAAQPAHAAGGGASGKKASAATTQHVQPNRSGRSAIAATNNARSSKKSETSTAVNQGQKGKKAQTSNAAVQNQKGKKNQTQAERQTAKAANQGRTGNANADQANNRAGKANQGKKAAANQNTAKGKVANNSNNPVKPRHFNLAKQPNTAKAPPVKFQQGRRIQGSQNWQGQKYAVYRNYQSQWHDQNWWHGHYGGNNFVFAFGAPYYWNAGYWFPAWGYSPNAYYAWDGPIYGSSNRMPPDQVIANAQSALQQQGYYHGDVDGLIGPQTRSAIADYQRNHGLYTTSTIDQPTLESLGIS